MAELERLIRVIKHGERHKWYDRVTKKAEEYLAIITGEDMDLGERTLHQLGVTASYDARQIRFSVALKAPLDRDLKEVLNSTIGLGISYLFE